MEAEPSSGEAPAKSIRLRAHGDVLAANLGEVANHAPVESAMALAQQPVFTVNPHLKHSLAWQNVSAGISILDKNGGLNNTSTYIGFAPQRS